jgi:hypothetical protein
MKPPLRTKSIGTKVSEEESSALEARARAVGLTLSEWVRDVLLSAPVESGPDSGEVALGEILVLRSLFLNLHFRAAGQSPVTKADVRGLIERLPMPNRFSKCSPPMTKTTANHHARMFFLSSSFSC